MGPLKFKRDREIFAALEAGWTVEQLAKRYIISSDQIVAIRNAEQCKRAVSPAPVHRAIRPGDPCIELPL